MFYSSIQLLDICQEKVKSTSFYYFKFINYPFDASYFIGNGKGFEGLNLHCNQIFRHGKDLFLFQIFEVCLSNFMSLMV